MSHNVDRKTYLSEIFSAGLYSKSRKVFGFTFFLTVTFFQVSHSKANYSPLDSLFGIWSSTGKGSLERVEAFDLFVSSPDFFQQRNILLPDFEKGATSKWLNSSFGPRESLLQVLKASVYYFSGELGLAYSAIQKFNVTGKDTLSLFLSGFCARINGQICSASGNHSAAIRFFEQSNYYFSGLGYYKGCITNTKNFVDLYFTTGQSSSAGMQLRKLSAGLSDTKDSLQYYSLELLFSHYYLKRGYADSAMVSAFKASRFFERRGFVKEYALARISIASVFSFQKDARMSALFYDQAYSVFSKLGDWQGQLHAIHSKNTALYGLYASTSVSIAAYNSYVSCFLKAVPNLIQKISVPDWEGLLAQFSDNIMLHRKAAFQASPTDSSGIDSVFSYSFLLKNLQSIKPGVTDFSIPANLWILQSSFHHVRSSLKHGQVCISMVEFPNSSRSERYLPAVLLILKPLKQHVSMVSCGSLPSGLSSALAMPGNSPDALQVFYGTQKKGSILSDYLWSNAESFLVGSNTIFYSTTGWLEVINPEALKDQSGKFYFSRFAMHKIQFANCINAPSIALRTGDALLLTDAISFGTESRKLLFWKPLPAWKKESEKLHGMFKKSKKVFKRLSGVAAGESAFVSEVCNAAALHLQTHGYVFSKPDFIKKQDEGSIPTGLGLLTHAGSENILRRCGWVFSAANDLWDQESNAFSDGLLSAQSIANLNLTKLKLVVAGAPVTDDAFGQSEWISAMGIGLKTAGAGNLMLRLWDITEAESLLFLQEFYKRIFAGKSVHVSFNETRNLLMAKSEPSKWAGFILIE